MYQALFAASPVPFLVLAANPPDFTITDANDAFLAATNTVCEDLIGSKLFDVFPDDPNHPGLHGIGTLARSLDRVLATRRTDVMERIRYDITNAEGELEPHWWHAINAPVLDVSGEVTAIIHQVSRVTELHRAEEAAREAQKTQAFLLRLSDALQPLSASAEIEKTAVYLLGKELQVSRIFYATIDDGGESWSIQHEYTADGNSKAGCYPMSEFQRKRMPGWQAGRISSVADCNADASFTAEDLQAYVAFGARASIGIPIGNGRELLALLAVNHAEPRTWTQAEITLARETAERTWTAIERARAEEALRESEKRFSDVLEAMTDGFALLGSDYTILKVNEETLRLDGRTREQLIGRSHWEAFPGTESSPVGKTLMRVARDRVWASLEHEYRWPDGRCLWLDMRAYPTQDGGVAIFWHDVTERRRTEAALTESEHRFREFGENSSDVLWIIDAESMRLAYLSPAFERIWGQRRDDVMADISCWMTFLHPDDRASALQAMPRLLAGESFVAEYRIVRPDGEIRWIRDAGFPIMENGVVKRGGGIAQDVTGLKQAEFARQESETRLQEFGEASQDVLWIRDAGTLQWRYLTPAFEEIYGLHRDEALTGNNYRGWIDLIVPEDREHAMASIERVRRGERVAFEYRIRRPIDGAIRLLRNTDFPIRDANGQVALIGGVGHDLTDLREVELRLRALMEGIPQLVWRAAHAGHWTWASPQWTAYTGQTESDSHGLGWLEPIHESDRALAHAAWDQAVICGEFEAECRIRAGKTGMYRWFQTRATPVRDEAGTIIEWLGTSTDIHDLRMLQDRQYVMVTELQHRTRNLIAVVSALSSQTLRNAESLGDFEQHFSNRLAALSRVQGLLSQLSAGKRVTFDELLRSELTALGAPVDKVTLDGPIDVPLRSTTVQTFSLALHELATNALKYGALTALEGHLTVRWTVKYYDGESPRLQVDWRETGVVMPDLATRPRGGGFGRELIERALPYQLDAQTTFEMTPDGVHCTIDVPISALENGVGGT